MLERPLFNSSILANLAIVRGDGAVLIHGINCEAVCSGDDKIGGQAAMLEPLASSLVSSFLHSPHVTRVFETQGNNVASHVVWFHGHK
jgi:hypothetical protein